MLSPNRLLLARRNMGALGTRHLRTFLGAGAAQIRELQGQRRICPDRTVRSQLTKQILNLRWVSRRRKYDAMLDATTSPGEARQWR